MPNPRDILDLLNGDVYFSTLDCASAYWAIEIAEEDQHKNAFVCPRSLFEMNIMPFGFVNSQSSYQRLMDTTFKNVKHAEPCIDDICVHSRTFEHHLEDLESVFQALGNANIQLRKEKCNFGFREVEFIGHVISHDGHHPTPRLLEKIRDVQPPKGKKDLQRFLSLANFSRDHVPGFAQIAEPLYKLTQKEILWIWDNAADNAYSALKRELTDIPVILAYPNWKKEFLLQTDASSIAVGAVLSQRDEEGHIKPISYFSSGLTPAQRNYSAGELECWALIASSRKFQKYLQGAPGVVFLFDYNPLIWLKKQKDTRGKFTRWVQELEALNYKVEYIKGKNNVTADCLSRLHSKIDEGINDENEHFERHLYSILDEEANLVQRLKQAQEADGVVSTASNQIREKGAISEGQFKKDFGMAITNGLLYIGLNIVVPSAMKHYFDVAYLPWSSENHRYFLLMVDGFSKFTELVPMPNQEAETIVNAILTTVEIGLF